MIFPEITLFVSTVGFPITMCFYLLLRFEKKLTENTKVVEALIRIIKIK